MFPRGHHYLANFLSYVKMIVEKNENYQTDLAFITKETLQDLDFKATKQINLLVVTSFIANSAGRAQSQLLNTEVNFAVQVYWTLFIACPFFHIVPHKHDEWTLIFFTFQPRFSTGISEQT